MGKVDENKQQKSDALYRSAYDLFIEQGIEKTSISDIAKYAGVAKGTFYLYFTDKYELRDRLIAKITGNLFLAAWQALESSHTPQFEDRIIFIVDYILERMKENKPMLRFISKNLSWGIFKQAILQSNDEEEINVKELYRNHLLENPVVKLRDPETMMFLIIELASSTSYSTILENDPMPFEDLKPYLNASIRAIIKNHVIS
ncbi:TetR/AcrR family transcriptional regulator [bacterium]|uniref:TetR/AcrR family transcriptional regulator n=1 Tax=Lachnospiraceae TaxID=186803 RepID=UPI002A33A2B9|nr:TetR/AcrR family transcriptional regulator [bacterium]MDY2884137.1 TetR/AcrR family transcriptional regulator [Bariatricus sp.]MCI7149795.1 TetR/AcrR family transcriptional regulator [bacterium]MDD6514572.1 TetR/AcrR family transcriptional regulator [bacterium]MDY4192888.1 TetR/AcrR family transcriptional regulator [Bariatricus sp.]